METLTKIAKAIAIVASVLAIIGTTGYLFYDHHALFAIASLIVDAVAMPTIIKWAKELIA